MSKRRYTAVESQLIISPLSRWASAMPSALLPVAVGPTMATTRGCRISGPRVPAPASTADRSAAFASDGSSVWVFVEIEGDREERAIVGVLRRQRIGRIGCDERTER